MSQPAESNYTPRAQQVLALARLEADRLNHNFIGTEHLLLGLLKLGQGVSVNVLRRMGLDLERVRLEVEKTIAPGPFQKGIGPIPFTPRVKKVLALAQEEAKALNHTYVGTEHFLLGLLSEGDGVAARVLANLGVDIKRTRQEILKELNPNIPDAPMRPLPPGPLLCSEGASKVLAFAAEEARALDLKELRPEHFLLGLLREGNNVGACALKNLGVEFERARQEILKLSPRHGPDNKSGAGPAT